MKLNLSKKSSKRTGTELAGYSSEEQAMESQIPNHQRSDLTMGPEGNQLQVAPDFPDSISVPRMPIDSTHVSAVNNILSTSSIAGALAFAGGPSSPVSVPTAVGIAGTASVINECGKCHKP